MTLAEHVYTLALGAARPAVPLLARGSGKLARGVRGRAGLLERLDRWAARERDPARPLAWFHAPSVGEGLQARAVIEALRARRPEVQIAYTFFSPSAEGFARGVPADWADYLPLDLPDDVGRALDLLRPAALAFSKTDVWPTLARAADQRGVRLALLSATLPAGSSRLGGPARWLLTPAYRRLQCVAAISGADADRFAALGVPAARRTVMGDARFDQVWARAEERDLAAPLLRPFADSRAPTLVAGSTWPIDEERLLPAVRRCRDAGQPLRVILVPHEPTPDHLAATEALLDRLGLAHARLGAVLDGGLVPEVVVVDRVGVLGSLYAVADLAYVGGGWGRAGLHSVLEPAAFGAPVLFGPWHANAREAAELAAAGAAFSAPTGEALAAKLEAWLAKPDARAAAGLAARAYVRAGLGAAERGAVLVETLLGYSSADSRSPSA